MILHISIEIFVYHLLIFKGSWSIRISPDFSSPKKFPLLWIYGSSPWTTSFRSSRGGVWLAGVWDAKLWQCWRTKTLAWGGSWRIWTFRWVQCKWLLRASRPRRLGTGKAVETVFPTAVIHSVALKSKGVYVAVLEAGYLGATIPRRVLEGISELFIYPLRFVTPWLFPSHVLSPWHTPTRPLFSFQSHHLQYIQTTPKPHARELSPCSVV